MVKQGDWSLLIPLGIGTLMLARYLPNATWLSRIAFAFIVGVGSGLAIPRIISSYILKQVEDTVRPLVSIVQGEPVFTYNLWDPSSSLNTIVPLIVVLPLLLD